MPYVSSSGSLKSAPPTLASDWHNLPPEAFACRDVRHAWPRNLPLEYFHVERNRRGRAVSVERRLPCTGNCGAFKVTPYVLDRNRELQPDPERRATVVYTRPYVLKREYPGQELPTSADFAAARMEQVPGLADLLR